MKVQVISSILSHIPTEFSQNGSKTKLEGGSIDKIKLLVNLFLNAI